MSTIKTGTTLTTAYQVEGDTTGTLVIQTGSTPTTALTVGDDQVVTFAQPPVGVGNAATVTNGVYTVGNQTIGGTKTFSNTIVGSINGNAATATSATSSATATNLSTDRTNWSTNGTISAVVGQLAWKNYGNSHTIFDASNSTSPNGTAVNNTNPDYGWAGTYPTLMGWNGGNTFGVRVDRAQYAEYLTTTSGSAPIYGARAWVNFNGTNLGIRASGNVSSISRVGTGNYTVNFSTAMPDANYATTCGVGISNASNFWGWTGGLYGTGAYGTTGVRVNNISKNNGTFSDNELFTVMVIR